LKKYIKSTPIKGVTSRR